tara:strand:- start:128 stop:1294 length:1167 start_codon:yes stop_codon:yes gene_type:complete
MSKKINLEKTMRLRKNKITRKKLTRKLKYDSYIQTELNNLLQNIDSDYGILISKDNKVIYEKYKNNNKNTRFRIFSCSKPITGLAIVLLAQMGKLKLTDTIDKFCINIPYNNKIIINHLLYHSSGVYDFSSKLYFDLKPLDMFNNILKKYETKFVDFETTIQEINKNKPFFTPMKEPYEYIGKNYNNTGYDILGYIIYVASGMKTDEFIKKYIFNKLRMKNSDFQHEKHKDESIPYEKGKKRGIKEQQNWFCGNAYVSCTLRDYYKFMKGYQKLLKPKYLKKYEKLYYFGKLSIKNNNKNIKYLTLNHEGGGDFTYLHSKGKKKYNPVSRTMMVQFYPLKSYKTYLKDNNNYDIKVILSENYRENNGFFTNNKENYNKIINTLLFPKS